MTTRQELQDELKACEEELQVHAALGGHAGIVRLHGANLRPPDCCIVMERCRFSLFERLHAQSQDLDRREMVNMAAQVADAMAFLHAQSPPIVHRDLKSHNVLLDDAGKCKLCDFGLVGTREVTAGTPNYMAPELFFVRDGDRFSPGTRRHGGGGASAEGSAASAVSAAATLSALLPAAAPPLHSDRITRRWRPDPSAGSAASVTGAAVEPTVSANGASFPASNVETVNTYFPAGSARASAKAYACR